MDTYSIINLINIIIQFVFGGTLASDGSGSRDTNLHFHEI
jgi:hypothetical protein